MPWKPFGARGSARTLQTVTPEMAVAVFRHLDTPAALGLEPSCEGAGMGAIGPHQLQTLQLAKGGGIDEGLSPKTVVQVGGVHMGKQDEPSGIDENAPLAPDCAFCRVVTARRAGATGCPHGLAVDDGRRWLCMSPLGLARETAEPVMHAPKRAVEPSRAKDGLPWRRWQPKLSSHSVIKGEQQPL